MDVHPLVLSVEVAFAATTLAAVAGVAISLMLCVPSWRGRHLLEAILMMPSVLPPTVLGYYLLVLVGRASFIGRTFEALTGTSIAFTALGAIVAAFCGALPIVIKTSVSALETVDTRLVDAARTLGATRLRSACSIQLPLARRGILAGLMLAFARSMGDFGATLMLAGSIPGKTQTAALFLYEALESNREQDARLTAAALSVTCVTLLYVGTKLNARSADA